MSDRLTPEREADIRARANAATPGHWGSHRDLNGVYTIQARPRTTRYGMENDGDITTLASRTDADSYANASFIAHARTDVEALLAELAAVRAERDLAQRKVASLKAQQDKDDAEYAEVIAERDSAREALREAGDQIAALESDLGGATARIAELTAERHTTNEALDDAVRELRRRDLLHTQTAEEASHG